MRDRFKWYLNPGSAELANIWDVGILTVDANVILDIYRYHEKTRQEIQRAIGAFGDRVWLSNQAANEFINNRKKVISSSEKTFREAEKILSSLRKSNEAAVGDLKSHRLVPREVLDRMAADVGKAVEIAESQIAEAKVKYPKFLKDDEILEWVLSTFDGRLGEAPNNEELSKLKSEGEERRSAQIPPGYLDGGKDGDRPYGDFILWKQTMSRSKEIGLPMILVTSERKEDWWEVISGKTVGPRIELMREAVEVSGSRILIYQTEHFLQLASQKIGAKVDEAAVEEIRQINTKRAAPSESAIIVTHLPISESTHVATGIMTVDLRRSVRNFTCTAILDLAHKNWIDGVVDVEMVAHPTDMPKTSVKGKFSQFEDVNIHCHALEQDRSLPVGQYQFRYVVTFPDYEISGDQKEYACPRCGRAEAWNGPRCMSCGFIDDE